MGFANLVIYYFGGFLIVDFTPAQIVAIEKIVDLKLQLFWNQKHSTSRTNDNFHTKAEIRSIIQANMDDIAAFLGPDSFSVQVLHHYLGKFVTFRTGDHKPHPSGGTRWKSQVTGVIASHPCFKPTGTAGIYKLTEAVSFRSNTLFNNQ